MSDYTGNGRSGTFGSKLVPLRDGERTPEATADPLTVKATDDYAKRIAAMGPIATRAPWNQRVRARLNKVGTQIMIAMSGGSPEQLPLIVASPATSAYTTTGVAAWSSSFNRSEPVRLGRVIATLGRGIQFTPWTQADVDAYRSQPHR